MTSLRREVDDLVYHKRLQEEFVAKPMLSVMAEVAGRETITSSQVESGSTAELTETGNREHEELMGNFGGIHGRGRQ